jgi:hypothetical protein
MRIVLVLVVLLSVFGVAAEEPSPVGTWEGESLCMVLNSPCHDEHVVYEIKKKADSEQDLTIDAFKIVNGEKQFMGALDCLWKKSEKLLECHYRADDDWVYKIDGNRMQGTLHIGKERQLYRKINVTKKP